MAKVFVITEISSSFFFDHLFYEVIGVVSGPELAEALISRRHPLLTVEARKEVDGSGLDMTLRGAGLDEDGTDLEYNFEIRPFDMDPTSVEAVPLPKPFARG